MSLFRQVLSVDVGHSRVTFYQSILYVPCADVLAGVSH